MEVTTLENASIPLPKEMLWEEIKTLYPNEWVLIGNPGKRKDIWNITSGVPLHHSPDKRTVCFEGREILKKFSPQTHTFVFTGESKFPKRFMTGIFGRVAKDIY